MARKKTIAPTVTLTGSSVENRLSQALIYKKFMDLQLCTPEEVEINPQTGVVCQEIKDFMKNRLEILLGLEAEPEQYKKELLNFNFVKKSLEEINSKLTNISEFSESEKQALKALAKATMGKTESTSTIEHIELTSPKPEDGIYALPMPKRVTRALDANGKPILGSDGKEVLISMAGQTRIAKDPDRLPMPSPNQVAMIAAEHSNLMQGEDGSLASSILTVLSGGGVHTSNEE